MPIVKSFGNDNGVRTEQHGLRGLFYYMLPMYPKIQIRGVLKVPWISSSTHCHACEHLMLFMCARNTHNQTQSQLALYYYHYVRDKS